MLGSIRIRGVVTGTRAAVRQMSQFKKVGVVGLGLMGHGVAQVTAQAGFQVVAIESNAEALAVGMKR